MAGEDGQTFTWNVSLQPNTTYTLASTPGITDFNGNALQPFTIHFQTINVPSSTAPQLTVSPAAGAVNVPVNQTVELRYTQSVDGNSLQNSLHVMDAGVTAVGSITADAASQVFDFQPAAPYGAGDSVAVNIDDSVYTLSGVRVDPAWYSTFRTAPPTGASAAPVGFYITANAVELRFAGAVTDRNCRAYLYVNAARIRTECAVTAPDQIRLTASEPFVLDALYHVVVDASHEIAFRAPTAAQDTAPPVASTMEPGSVVALRFSDPVNPLWFRRIVRIEGGFTMQISLDGTEVRVTPSVGRPNLHVVFNGADVTPGRSGK